MWFFNSPHDDVNARKTPAKSDGIPPGGSRRPVSDRTIESDLRLLLAVLNWAAKSRDEGGRLLLESNPLRGLKLPKEKNPRRVVLTQAEYEALLRVAGEVDWRFRVALVLAHDTGHRIGAIRKLRWSDSDLDGRTIRWRGENEKTGYEHRTPVTAKARTILEEAPRHNPGIGDAPLLPAPKDAFACMSRSLARDWWRKAETLAELEPKRLRGWHSLRRKRPDYGRYSHVPVSKNPRAVHPPQQGSNLNGDSEYVEPILQVT